MSKVYNGFGDRDNKWIVTGSKTGLLHREIPRLPIMPGYFISGEKSPDFFKKRC
jgi:hypothetical protein